MNAKTVLYAAVGAPVVAVRKIGDRFGEIRTNLNKEANSFGETANKRIKAWAGEGEKVINRITDAKVVDDLTAKVDFDQVSTQVSKLRDQLEDMLSTWRSSFRPERLPTIKVEASTEGVKVKAVPSKATKAAKARSSNGGAAASTGAKATKSVAKKAPAKKSAAKKAATTAKKAS